MIPDALNAVLNHYDFGTPQTIEHFESGGEWRVRGGGRVLRWALVGARAADHITRDAGMLTTLEHHRIPAPKLLALDTAGTRQVVSVQHLLLPDARSGAEAGGLTERGWHALGAYLYALHERGPRSPTVPEGQVGLGALRLLEGAGVLSAADNRWLRQWWGLLSSSVPLVLTHGYVAPNWVVADERGDLVLGLTDWGIAEMRLPGHDFLFLPEPALWTVLEGYGPTGLPLFLRAKLSRLVEDALNRLREETAAPGARAFSVVEEFGGILERAGLSRPGGVG